MNNENEYRCGYVSIIGRPNVGKSTLLNQLLNVHLSITSKKPQTTQHRILGIKTTDKYQAVYIDTPGIHHHLKSEIHRYMNREATSAMSDVDVIVLMMDATTLDDEDKRIIEQLKLTPIPVILCLNKIDKYQSREQLLPFIEKISQLMQFKEIIPVSAKKNDNLTALENCIYNYLQQSPPYFDENQLTDKNDRFLAAELIREQLMRYMGQELPYAVAVEIEAFEETHKIIKISALIWVERDNQKAILIGKQGEQLKQLGIHSRKAMQRLFAKKVLLKLWIKVKSGWSDDQRSLKSLGYQDD